MSEELDRQAIIDEEHLKLLVLGNMISAGMAAFFALAGVFYILMGLVMSFAFSHIPADKAGNQPPVFIGFLFAGIGVVFFVLASGVALARFWAGRCIKHRKSRTFCLVVAGINCLEFPYGTALGVLTFMVLGRPSVVKLFEAKPEGSSARAA